MRWMFFERKLIYYFLIVILVFEKIQRLGWQSEKQYRNVEKIKGRK
jgi:hypothetical protein